MTHLITVFTGCLALAAAVSSCGPALKSHSSPERQWGTPAQRYEGCCQPRAVAAAQSPAGSEAAQPKTMQDWLRGESVEKRFQEIRDREAKAEAHWEKRRELRARAEAYREKKEAEAREATKAKSRPKELCAELHPEAKYMTPPDEEGTLRPLPKQVEDFEGFASCFNQRYGGAFAAQDFRPCNSIPNISEEDRLQCLEEKYNKERPDPSQWCSARFDVARHLDMWRQCTNEFLSLDGMALLDGSQPKTPAELAQDERDFVEDASARARDSYRTCILQYPQPTALQRQYCRDHARLFEKLQEFLEEFDSTEGGEDERPEGGLRPDEL